MKKFLTILAIVGSLVTPAASNWIEPSPQFIFARLQCSNRDHLPYWKDPFDPPWHHDYPASDEFITALLHELTGVRVAPDSYKIVRLDSDEVFKYPFVYLSEPGFLALTDKEIENLGEYIRRGGFIMADDFRTAAYLQGPEELDVLRDHLKLAVPESEFVRLDSSHPVFHTFYDIASLTMTPPYGEWAPEFWGLSDENGRLQMIAYYNNDIGDFWKYLDHGDKPLGDSTLSIRIGINSIVYALSH